MIATVKDERASAGVAAGLACPACACGESVEVRAGRVDEYRVRRCAECDLVYADPMKSADAGWYASSWLYGMRDSHRPAVSGQCYVPWNFAQALAELPPQAGTRVLDVGCAEGYFLHLAQKMNCEVTGLDFNPAALKTAKARLGVSTVYPYSVEELRAGFPGVQFDVATIFEVLEHTSDPYEILRSIRGLLRTGGKLLLSVPGVGRWPRLFDEEVDAPPHHLTLWTEAALRKLLTRAGFRVREVRAKPLGAEDLGLHLKWRCYRALRRMRAKPLREKPNATDRDGGKQSKAPTGMLRGLGVLGLAPLCWALRLNPRAGGFTLFAYGKKD